MSTFTEAELGYLAERRLARLATVGRNGMPHVTPVGMWSHNREDNTIEVTGHDFADTKKFRDVRATGTAAIVIDDLVSTDPWHARGVEVRGHADTVTDPQPSIRVHPDRVISWGLDQQPEPT